MQQNGRKIYYYLIYYVFKGAKNKISTSKTDYVRIVATFIILKFVR